MTNRTKISDIVASQLPEFVRAEYPTFVAFVEAYYEYLNNNYIDLKSVRDIDETLTDFIKYFKAELAHNYPVSASFDTERYLLKHIKDQYLAKGSEASYKLLFRLLYGKEVYMDYPGKQMLRVSAGQWQQDVSIFVRVDFGDPMTLIGKNISIQTTKKISRDATTKKAINISTVTANIENILHVSGNVYEFYLDRNFYGEIFPNDVVKYKTQFQGQILPCTADIEVKKPGVLFRPGMVFSISSGEGSPLWFKVIKTDETGGLINVDIIKFGLNYKTDFSVNILPTSAITTRKAVSKSGVVITYSLEPGVISSITVNSGGAFYQQTPDVIIGGDGTGATAHAVMQNGAIKEIVIDNQGSNYTTAFISVTPKPGDIGNGAELEAVIGNNYSWNFNDETSGFTEAGYLNHGDYWDYNFSDGAYVGTIIRQFFIDARDTIKENPATLKVSLGAVSRYPGYYKTNDGFLSDSIYIQDSYYYQTFSYVIRIDEQLQKYSSVVRTMLHPSGMALFGEYSINNNINLSIALDSFVKSLGVTLYDSITLNDEAVAKFSTKYLDGEAVYPIDRLLHVDVIKALEDAAIPTDPFVGTVTVLTGGTGYQINPNVSITGGGGSGATATATVVAGVITKIDVTNPGNGYTTDPTVTITGGTGSGATFKVNRIGTKLSFGKSLLDNEIITDLTTLATTKSVADSFTQTDVTTKSTTKGFTEAQYLTDLPTLTVGLNKVTDTIATPTEVGYLHGSPYDQGGYFSELYNAGRLRDFSS